MYVTSRPVEQPPPRLVSLLDLVTQDIDYRYTDIAKRLTAIKDKDLRSCFVTDYDPQWNLYKSEKESIYRKKTYDIVRTPPDFTKLRKKAGNIIANMCKKVKIFWMNERPAIPQMSGGLLPPPLPMNPGNSQTLVEPPPLLPVPNERIDQDGSPTVNAPPPLLPGASSGSPNGESFPPEATSKETIVAPPMRETENAPPMLSPQNSGSPDDKIETPPPLNLWRQMHPENSNTKAPPLLAESGNEMREPPKLTESEHSGVFIEPPKVQPEKYDDLIEPPKLQSNNMVPDFEVPPKRPVQMQPPDFRAPPRINFGPPSDKLLQERAVDILEPVPDLRTPPSPFRK